MKDFLKTTLAVICGTLLTSALFFFVVAGFFGSLLAFSESTPVLPKSGVLVVDMSKIVLSEQIRYHPLGAAISAPSVYGMPSVPSTPQLQTRESNTYI